MGISRTLRVAAVVAAAGSAAGLAAASATASWDITGGNYSAALGTQTFTIDNTYTFNCATSSMAGNTDNVVGEPEASRFAASFGSCDFFGFPGTVTSDPWKLVITAGSFGGYSTNVLLESGNAIHLDVPMVNCTFTVSGPQSFVNAAPDSSGLLTVGGNAYIGLNTESLQYTANSGCTLGTAGTVAYRLGWNPVVLSGVGVTP